jgi:hypothetical protein
MNVVLVSILPFPLTANNLKLNVISNVATIVSLNLWIKPETSKHKHNEQLQGSPY